MRCSICSRPLIRCAVPGLAIGPNCARKRGLMPERLRIRRVEDSARETDPRQVDWISSLPSIASRCTTERA